MGGHGHDEGHGHSHDHGHSHGGKDLEAPLLPKQKSQAGGLEEEQVKLKKAVYFALFMMSVEIIGGVIANSLAIVTDAAHMLSDVGGFVVSLVCLQLAAQAATQEYTYGFKQAEVLGALMSIMIVWALTGVLLWEAVKRLYEPQPVNAPFMFGISVLGFFVNICLMQVLGHGHAHGGHGHGGHGHGGHGGHADHGCSGHGYGDHGHGGHAEHGTGHAEHGIGHSDSHGGHEEDEEASASLAMKAAIAHVIGDIVQSLGVCVAALCIWLQPFDVGFTDRGVSKWNYADPCCTVLFGILVLLTTKSTLSQTINSLMVKAPPHINQTVLKDKLIKCPSVQSIHDLHVWSLGSKDVLCTAHLMVEGRENAMPALIAAVKVAKKMGIGHSTFQIEVVGEFDPALETYGFHDNPMGSPTSEASNSKDHGHEHGHAGGHGHGHEGKGHDGHGHKEDHGHSHDGGACSGHGGESKAHGHDEGHGHGHEEGHSHGGGHGAHGHDEGHGHGHEEGHSHGGGHGVQPATGSGVVSYYGGAPRVAVAGPA